MMIDLEDNTYTYSSLSLSRSSDEVMNMQLNRGISDISCSL